MVRQARREYDPVRLESEMRATWEKEGTYREARRRRAGGPKWYFIDGPPYATGHIHLGTAWNKVLKDAMLRYMSMRGFDVRDQPGFDMHGLPIEVKVEKDLGITSKKQIEERGVADFVERCRRFALDHLAIMTDEFKELGVWMDWDRPYMTITNEYIEGGWWTLAEANRHGLLYEAERVLTWCWRCETALAAAEVEHEERKDPSVYVKFPIAGRPGESLVVWTTTPWTLPANVAVAAHPALDYARVKVARTTAGGGTAAPEARPGGDRKGVPPTVTDEVLLVAAAQAEAIAKLGRYQSFEVLETMPGASLEGLRYEHPFADEVPRHREERGRERSVLLAEHVEADRTGLVHTATGHGAEDFDAGRAHGIPPFSPVGEDGRYTDAAGAFAGLHVKLVPEGGHLSEADARVVALLKEKGLLLHQASEKHAYGHCWRCKNPIIFRATSQWFVAIEKIKDRMLAETARVRWTPEWAGSARQADWVRQARDWCVSRQRYWGIPIPVWRCAEGCLRVVGSREELAKAAKQGKAQGWSEGMDLHRPHIDAVTLTCDRHRLEMRRVPDVFDVWFDSAVAGWASLAWPSRREEMDKWFPCDFIVEGLDQTRGWFYSQLAAGVASMDRVPYERVLMHGFVHDDKGRPMSKSLGNIVPPHDVVVKHGADAFRFHVLSVCAPWEDIHFGWDGVRNTERTLNILWNVHVFATTYMAIDGWTPQAPAADAALTVEDRWLRSRVAATVEAVTREMQALHLHRAARAVESFVLEDLSRWYVRLVRDRVWNEADDAGKRAAYATLHEALLTTARLLAPFAPFLADALRRDLVPDGGSVHHDAWPVPDARARDGPLENAMATARAVVDATAAARQQAQMKLRWPVAKLTVATDDADARAALERFRHIVEEQANAKALEFVPADWEGLDLEAVPDKGLLGRTFRGDAPAVVRALLDADQTTLQAVRRDVQAGRAHPLSVAGKTVALPPEAVSFRTRLPPNLTGASFGIGAPDAERGEAARSHGSVYLDTRVTPEIEAEGYARELVRRVQDMRRELELPVAEHVPVTLALDDALRALVAPHAESIARDVRARPLAFAPEPQGRLVKDWDVEGRPVRIAVG